MDVKLKIGLRIKSLREAVKMSQKDLSYASDLDRSYIASISIVNIEKIAKALNVNLKEFFNDDEFDKNSGSSSRQISYKYPVIVTISSYFND
jgi:transcriptional regulator with XRE-family HTH domain